MTDSGSQPGLLLTQQPSPIQMLSLREADSAGVAVAIKRDDLIHPQISGNKWRKLSGLLAQLKQDPTVSEEIMLASMGGVWSNHLHALAFAGKQLGYQTHGLVRGHPAQFPNPCLADCKAWGMRLHWITRQNYPRLRDNPDAILQQLGLTRAHWVAEGGAGDSAEPGLRELAAEIINSDIDWDFLVLPVGTGTTLRYLSKHLPASIKCIGICALNNSQQLQQQLRQEVGESENWLLWDAYHLGGIGKTSIELFDAMATFSAQTKIELEPVYTGKAWLGLARELEKRLFPRDSKILLLHTGGLQGRRGFGTLDANDLKHEKGR